MGESIFKGVFFLLSIFLKKFECVYIYIEGKGKKMDVVYVEI